jgi:thiamine biosynthesis lipoprotein ApbE
VLADNATTADAWATAFSVLGAEASLDVSTKAGVGVYLLQRQAQAFVGQGNVLFEQLIRDN